MMEVPLLSVQLEPTDTLVPLANCVRIMVDEMKKKSAGGVLLPDQVQKKVTYYTGTVEAIGPDVDSVEVGWRVAWTQPPLIFTGKDDRVIILDHESLIARIT